MSWIETLYALGIMQGMGVLLAPALFEIHLEIRKIPPRDVLNATHANCAPPVLLVCSVPLVSHCSAGELSDLT